MKRDNQWREKSCERWSRFTKKVGSIYVCGFAHDICEILDTIIGLESDRPTKDEETMFVNVAKNPKDYKDEDISLICMKYPCYKHWAEVVKRMEKTVVDIVNDKGFVEYDPFSENKTIKPLSELDWANLNTHSSWLRDASMNIADAILRVFDYYENDVRTRQFIDGMKIENGETLIIDGRSGGQVSETLIDKDKLKELFVPAFQDKSYKTIDKSTESEKISRFDVFCSRLDMTLNDARRTNKIVGEIAYLVYMSKYTSPGYRRPSRSGQRGKFRQLLKQIAEAVNMDDFYLQPAKCKNSSNELKSTFDML